MVEEPLAVDCGWIFELAGFFWSVRALFRVKFITKVGFLPMLAFLDYWHELLLSFASCPPPAISSRVFVLGMCHGCLGGLRGTLLQRISILFGLDVIVKR
jgi:hypothetical protein